MDDEPIEYGDDCLLGFDPGKTPKYLYVRFSLVVKCPDVGPNPFEMPPNDRVFKLTQHVTNPCDWVYLTTPWRVFFTVVPEPVRNWLLLADTPLGRWYFFDSVDGVPDEGHVFHNWATVCDPGVPSIEGIAIVTWTKQATDILESINMEKAQDLFMEMRPLDDGKLVYKFCRLKDATNIAILFEP